LEAIIRKKEVDEMKTLAKEHTFGVFQTTGPDTWELGLSPGWRQPTAGAGFFVSETYFDLAGLTMDDKTLFFEAAASTTMFNPLTTASNAGDGVQILNLMTSTPMTDDELSRFFLMGNFADAFGGIEGISYDETIYARCQEYTTDLDTAAWGKMVLVSDNQIGSLEATASDRIYSYKVVGIKTGALMTGLQTYPTRHILRATAREEPEYQYLMRLMRSYQLQQRFDRD
jgi:hypothetical protein